MPGPVRHATPHPKRPSVLPSSPLNVSVQSSLTLNSRFWVVLPVAETEPLWDSPAIPGAVKTAMVAAHFAVDAPCLAPLVVHHGQLRGGGMRGGSLGGRSSGFSYDGSVWVPQKGLSKVRFLKYLPALVHDPGQ